jgi:hypothetical protein
MGRYLMLTRSVEGEQRREDDHDRGRPQGEDGQVGGLPALEPVEPAASSEESGGEPGGPGQVREEDEVEAERCRSVRGEARSPIRAIIAPSTIKSSTRALTTATSWIRSIQPSDSEGSRADIPYRTRARTTTSRAPKTLTRSRSNASPRRFRLRRRSRHSWRWRSSPRLAGVAHVRARVVARGPLGAALGARLVLA